MRALTLAVDLSVRLRKAPLAVGLAHALLRAALLLAAHFAEQPVHPALVLLRSAAHGDDVEAGFPRDVQVRERNPAPVVALDLPLDQVALNDPAATAERTCSRDDSQSAAVSDKTS